MRSLFALFLLLGSCAGTPTDELAGEVPDDVVAGKADTTVTRPYGTWTRTLGEDEYGFTLLELYADHTYHYSQVLVNCQPGDCVDEKRGPFRFTKVEDRRYVPLEDDDGAPWYVLAYELDDGGDTLALRYAGESSWFFMQR
jgi:hypothetical protein